MSGSSSSGQNVKGLTEYHEDEIAKAGTKTWAEVKEQMKKLEEENQRLKDKVREMEMKVTQAEKMAKAETESDTSELTGIDTGILEYMVDTESLATKGEAVIANETEIEVAKAFKGRPTSDTEWLDKVEEKRTETQAFMNLMLKNEDVTEEEKNIWAEMIGVTMLEEQAKLKRQKIKSMTKEFKEK